MSLLTCAPQEIAAPYFFQCASTESSPYPRGHAQVRINSTAAILPDDIFCNFNQGIFIDIFVFDAVPDNQALQLDFASEIENQRHVIRKWLTHFSLSSRPRKIYNIFRNIVYTKTHSFMREYEKFESILSRYPINDNKYLVKLGLKSDFEYIVTKKLDKCLYEETLWLPFEDFLMPVPSGYDVVLKTLYGDYMRPVKEPTFHGEFVVLDAHRSYVFHLVRLRFINRTGKIITWMKTIASYLSSRCIKKNDLKVY